MDNRSEPKSASGKPISGARELVSGARELAEWAAEQALEAAELKPQSASGKPISGARELAEWAAEQALEAAELKPLQLLQQANTAQVALVPRGTEIRDLKPYLPKVPDRKCDALVLLSVESFCRLVNEQKEPQSRCFADLHAEPYSVTCRVDWHGQSGEAAGWDEFTITLQLRASNEFKAWAGINGKMLRQAEFAEFLKDNRLDITDPNGGEVLALVMNLEANSERRCRGRVPTNAGQTISFEEDTHASVNGTTITVPDRLGLRFPLFDGGAPIPIDADFKLRIQDGYLMFGVRLLGIDRTVRAALLAVAGQIQTETGIPVYM